MAGVSPVSRLTPAGNLPPSPHPMDYRLLQAATGRLSAAMTAGDPMERRQLRSCCRSHDSAGELLPGPAGEHFGNMTRYNPKYRSYPNLNENISLAKSFPMKEQVRLDLRGEFFNAFNRTRFGLGSLGLQSQTFGVLSQTAGDQANSPRQIQLALKLYF